jgi:dTDP-4-dehydrorhamnose reductase
LRALVLGAGGMAGHTIALYLGEAGFSLETLSATKAFDQDTYLMDVTDLDGFRRFLQAHAYDAVINCIGLLVKPSEERKDLAVYLNAFLPRFLEQHYRRSNTKLVHLSTDCVFSGMNAPYAEDSPYDGEAFYDRTKALGEVDNDKDLTFRMSIVGPEIDASGSGLFNWFCRQTGSISGYRNVIWNGVTTLELARAVVAALQQDVKGLYHLVPSRSITKLGLLELFKETFQRDDIQVEPVDTARSDKTLINTRRDFQYEVPAYDTMISEMKQWMDKHSVLYPHYCRQ